MVSPKIAYCMMIYGEREDEVRQCIERVRPYVDRIVLIEDGSLKSEFYRWLQERGCELYYKKWEDNFSDYRNEYLKRVGEKDRGNIWVLVSDPDELFDEVFLKDLRKIIKDSKNGILYNSLLINSHDRTIYPDGREETVISDFFKQLCFKYNRGLKYIGSPHEMLLGYFRAIRLDRKYYYTHTKTPFLVWERASRNFHIAGGGNNLREKNPIWKEYRNIVESLGLSEWTKMREYLRNGNIDQRIKDYLIKYRNRNFIPDADEELRNYFKWYFEYLHPEENIGNWKSEPEPLEYGSWGEVRQYVEQCYMKVLGRHADELGKQSYTELIITGKIKREDLPDILRNSPEYKLRVRYF